MSRLRAALVGMVVVGIMFPFAGLAAAENVLRWAFSTGALTFDPHSANSGPDDM